MDDKSMISLWDSICTGDQFCLCMTEQQKEDVVIPSEELILEDIFTGYNELSYPKEHILQLYPDHLVVREKITRKIFIIIKLNLVKCSWTKLKNKSYGINFLKNGQEFEVYTDKIHKFSQWKEALRKIVLVSDFHLEYKVTKQIGIGSFARVYYATRVSTGEEFAIKAFSKKALFNEDKGIEGLYQEIYIMRKLGFGKYHMNLYEIHETGHSVYMVVDYLPGGELLKVISTRQNRLKESTIRKLMRNILLGLEDIHERGIMHRDLKPENLMLKSKKDIYNVKIIDFGLSTDVDIEEYLYKRCGTPGFVAPEIISYGNEQDYNELCDIFSAGVIFYILLNGETPFPSSNYRKVLKQNKVCKIDFETEALEECSDKCMQLLKKMLAKDPKNRYSAKECIEHKFFSKLNKKADRINKNAGKNLLRGQNKIVSKVGFDYNQVETVESIENITRFKNKVAQGSTRYSLLKVPKGKKFQSQAQGLSLNVQNQTERRKEVMGRLAQKYNPGDSPSIIQIKKRKLDAKGIKKNRKYMNKKPSKTMNSSQIKSKMSQMNQQFKVTIIEDDSESSSSEEESPKKYKKVDAIIEVQGEENIQEDYTQTKVVPKMKSPKAKFAKKKNGFKSKKLKSHSPKFKNKNRGL